MESRTWNVEVGSDSVTVAFDPAIEADDAPVFVFAHGAGGHMGNRSMLALAAQFRVRGLHVVRFNFPYSERRSRRPDPMPLLMECIATVKRRAAEAIDADRWLLGGRSMGGRAASMLVADGFSCDGLLLLAYPLHPAGKPDTLRDGHLGRITPPVLCFNGTRDPLCHRNLMDAVVRRMLGNWRMHWLEQADHSFHVPKTSGRSDVDVLNEIGEATQTWVSAIKTPSAAVRHSPRRP